MSDLLKKLSKIQLELKAPKSNFNKFGGFYYRSLEDILEAVKPLLDKHGLTLTISDEPVLIGDRFYIKATARISDGKETFEVTAYAREAAGKKGMDEAQVTGASSSYARKYCLNGLFLIDDTKDPDTDEYTEQTVGNINELNNQIITLFAKALEKVGNRDKLYKQLGFNKTKMTELTKSDDIEAKRKVIEKLEGIINDGQDG